ncbi:hypothetical protein PV04_09320 [Phialophora macrospora]|uniref:Uncharacterized protein n=1 Tax=Phialophora macrospora TaxID=1851006 RepID=A0A0D2F8N8_9EURO|nr:hypothetical protein PV04_09320 [Phialophora macrospora]
MVQPSCWVRYEEAAGNSRRSMLKWGSSGLECLLITGKSPFRGLSCMPGSYQRNVCFPKPCAVLPGRMANASVVYAEASILPAQSWLVSGRSSTSLEQMPPWENLPLWPMQGILLHPVRCAGSLAPARRGTQISAYVTSTCLCSRIFNPSPRL